MTEQQLAGWNRGLVEETIAVLEVSAANAQDAISRLRGFLAVNPGGETVPVVSDHTEATLHQ